MEIVEAVNGKWIILVNGFQWGPSGSPIDKSGAYEVEYNSAEEAEEAYITYIENRFHDHDLWFPKERQ
jgi:hypothetical protein